MKGKGQRQDVAFLALAVALLAIAVALFVGIRALSNRGATKRAAPPPKQVAQRPPVAKPPGSKSHDPFKGKPTQVKPAPNAKPKPSPSEQLKLVGVVQGQGRELLAAIRRGNKRYYARQGDQVAGYTVAEVRDGRVVLTKAGEQMTLLLHHPSEGESER